MNTPFQFDKITEYASFISLPSELIHTIYNYGFKKSKQSLMVVIKTNYLLKQALAHYETMMRKSLPKYAMRTYYGCNAFKRSQNNLMYFDIDSQNSLTYLETATQDYKAYYTEGKYVQCLGSIENNHVTHFHGIPILASLQPSDPNNNETILVERGIVEFTVQEGDRMNFQLSTTHTFKFQPL